MIKSLSESVFMERSKFQELIRQNDKFILDILR